MADMLRIPTWDLAKRTRFCDEHGLIARFYELARNNQHLPRGGRGESRKHERSAFMLAHIEMWTIAQRLGAHQDPDLQWEIDILRAKIATQLTSNLQTGAFLMAPQKARRVLRWDEIDITPEFSCDPSLTGTTALARDVKRLKSLLHKQHVLINNLIRENTGNREM